jgi:hypothetical protein
MLRTAAPNLPLTSWRGIFLTQPQLDLHFMAQVVICELTNEITHHKIHFSYFSKYKIALHRGEISSTSIYACEVNICQDI